VDNTSLTKLSTGHIRPRLLSELLSETSEIIAISKYMPLAQDTLIFGLSDDSRLQQEGALFFAIRGYNSDGHDFIEEAVRNGAAAAVVEKPMPLDIPQIVVKSVRECVGIFASTFYGKPSEQMQITGVTGTNGKTTTCHLIYSCLLAGDRPAGEIGTIANRIGNEILPASLTTPEAIELQSLFYLMRENGVKRVAMEVSSHALDLHRVSGTDFEIGIFLNLTPEHLEYHKTMEAYFLAKSKLFNQNLCKKAIICIDDTWGKKLAAITNIPVITFGYDASADIKITAISRGLSGIELTLDHDGETVTINSGLVGIVNAENIAAAYIAARLLGIDRNLTIDILQSCSAPPGRFEIVSGEEPYLVIVDYAHTPNALEALIETGRAIAAQDGKITIVLGARGNRFISKRHLMGQVAETADKVIYTTDSPADEDPLSIIKDMLGERHPHLQNVSAGQECCNISIEPDRFSAIRQAVLDANDGDIIFITGRGHETSQKIQQRRVFLDDREAAKAAIAEKIMMRQKMLIAGESLDEISK